MTLVVVDTNIVFSAILSPKGKVHDLILNSDLEFTFYAPAFLIEELEIHHEKIKKISGFNDSEIQFLKRTIFQHINFIDPEIIREENWKRAFELVSTIDEKDTPFVSLTLEINGSLWTGDKKLRNGLLKKGINWSYSTNELMKKRDA